jgi:N-formylglutamate deformylase
MIPEQLRRQIVLSNIELDVELTRMTDAYTDELFTMSGTMVVRFPVSRLIVDVERFENDADEPMSKVGMGKIPMKTSHGERLRRELGADEVNNLINEYYRPHHWALQAAVEKELAKRGRALIIDCHSFPSHPLPCDKDQTIPRPDFCVGSDSFHTSVALLALVVKELDKTGCSIKINQPYVGTIVPMAFYGNDKRVSSIMIEVNRSLYMEEATGEKSKGFDLVREQIQEVLKKIGEFDRS